MTNTEQNVWYYICLNISVNITHPGISIWNAFNAYLFLIQELEDHKANLFFKNVPPTAAYSSVLKHSLTQYSHSSRLEHQAFFTTSCFYNHAVRWRVQLVINAISFTEGHCWWLTQLDSNLFIGDSDMWDWIHKILSKIMADIISQMQPFFTQTLNKIIKSSHQIFWHARTWLIQ